MTSGLGVLGNPADPGTALGAGAEPGRLLDRRRGDADRAGHGGMVAVVAAASAIPQLPPRPATHRRHRHRAGGGRRRLGPRAGGARARPAPHDPQAGRGRCRLPAGPLARPSGVGVCRGQHARDRAAAFREGPASGDPGRAGRGGDDLHPARQPHPDPARTAQGRPRRRVRPATTRRGSAHRVALVARAWLRGAAGGDDLGDGAGLWDRAVRRRRGRRRVLGGQDAHGPASPTSNSTRSRTASSTRSTGSPAIAPTT